MLTDGRTDGRTENRTPISHPATSRCDNKLTLLPDQVSKIAGFVANSVDPDHTSPSAASDLVPNSLLRSVRILKVNMAVHSILFSEWICW